MSHAIVEHYVQESKQIIAKGAADNFQLCLALLSN